MKSKILVIFILSLVLTALCSVFSVYAYVTEQPIYNGDFTYWIKFGFPSKEHQFVCYSNKPFTASQLRFVPNSLYIDSVSGTSFVYIKRTVVSDKVVWEDNYSQVFAGTNWGYSFDPSVTPVIVSANYNIPGLYTQKNISLVNLIDYSQGEAGNVVTTVTNQKTSAVFSLLGCTDWTYNVELYTKKSDGVFDFNRRITNLGIIVGGDGNVTFSYDQLNWIHGVTRIRWILTRAGETETFDFDVPVDMQTPYAKLTMLGSVFVKCPEMVVTKYKYPDPVELFLNDKLVATITESDVTRSFYAATDKAKLGTNIVTLKKRDGTVLQTMNFLLNANEEGSITPNDSQIIDEREQEKGGVDKNGKPIAPTSKNPIDWFFYIMNYAGWVFTSVSSMISGVVTQASTFSSLLRSLFGFLPEQYITVMITALTCGILLRIFNR